MDMTPVNSVVNHVLGWFVSNPSWKFDAEHVTVINALTIIILQLFISALVKKKPALPTMIFGISIATLGMALLAVSMNAWVFVAGLFIFSIGEMVAHPKFLSYIGLTAPPDKKALYLGYSFLYGVIGSGVGGILGATLYVSLVEKNDTPALFWLIFVAIGIMTIIGLLIYDRFIARRTNT
jgi:MFS family permease